MTANSNIFDLLELVEDTAESYETSLAELEQLANSGRSTTDANGVTTSRGNIDVATLTVASNEIALRQSIMDMATGITKSATGVVKKAADNLR